MKWSVFCVFGFLSLLATQPVAGQQVGGAAPINFETARLERRLVVVRATGPITLDGELNEEAWRDAPIATNFIQNEPREGQPATHDTEVRVIYDDDALYFGVFAKDDEPGELIVNDLKKDFATATSDGFRIVLDTFKDGRNGYEFATNPAGAKWDGQMANEGRESNPSWDGIWDVQTRVNEVGWYAEIRIPFLTLKFAEGDVQTWGVNFERKVRRLNEDTYWSPLPRIYEITRVSLAGSLEGMRGVRPGRNIRIKPYALGSSHTVTGLAAEGDGDVGLDVKYGVTTGLIWDFTVNTDFSQVEADEQQVNLSRFNLLFPEKREFFLENSGIFQFGGGATVGGGGGGGGGRQNRSEDPRLFFSRRIGLSDGGDAIPILAGTRLSGRVGRYSVGVLNVQQREQDGVPSANFSAFRVRRDILQNSDIGVMFMNRDDKGFEFNRAAGVDANFRFGFLTVDGYVAKTFSPEESLPGSGEDLATRAHANYQSRTWQFRGMYSTIGERFDDRMGYIPRTGVDNRLLFVGRAFRPSWLSKFGLREVRPHWQMDAYWRRDGGKLESRYFDYHLPFNFNDGAFIEIGINPNEEEISRPFTINNARGIQVGPGHYKFNEKFVVWRTNQAARYAFEVRYTTGDFYDGSRRGYTFGPNARFNEKLNASVNLQINDIDLSAGSFVSKLVTSRVNYNFNTKAFINALIQYNTDNQQWSSNIRFNLIHRPLSDLFVVYNERRDDRTEITDRAFVVKMTYLMAF